MESESVPGTEVQDAGNVPKLCRRRAVGPATGGSHFQSYDSHVILFCVQKDDPFWEPTDVDVHIGSVHVYLPSLTYMVMDDVMMMQYIGDKIS